jgi:hypothetical protein
VFENRVVRRIFGPMGDEVTGGQRKLNVEELRDLHSPSTIRMMKSRRISWARNIARMGRRGILVGYCWGNQKKEDTRRTKSLMGKQY